MASPLHFASLTETAAQLVAGEISSVELVQTYVRRIQALAHLHAFVTVAEEQALAAARAVDQARQSGQRMGPLAGIPLAVKDSIPTAGIRTTGNSRLLEQWVPAQDAAPVAHLRAAGAIILGKTNLNEFGWAIPSDNDLTPTPCNPWNPKYAALGSSSGSGIAVAAGLCCGALGTDGGGSTRLPAGQHGIIGIKPTHGRVSRLNMDNSTFSEISPLARTTQDAALLLQIMSGHEPEDPQSWPLPAPSYASLLETDLRGWRLGVPSRYVETAPLEPEVQASFEAGLRDLERLGLQIVDVDIAGLAEARMANFIMLNAEAHAEHAASLRDHPEKFGHSAYVYHQVGSFLSAEDYLHACEIGRQVRRLVQKVFADVRAFVTPVSPFVSSEAARQPGVHRTGGGAAFTAPFNATGHPAICVPCGMSGIGLPMGLQIVGPLYDELTLFQIAYAYEQATTWHTLHPDL